MLTGNLAFCPPLLYNKLNTCQQLKKIFYTITVLYTVNRHKIFCQVTLLVLIGQNIECDQDAYPITIDIFAARKGLPINSGH